MKSAMEGGCILECFSQNKDELMVGISVGEDKDIWLRAELSNGAGFLSVFGDYHRARANSVDLFQEIIGRHIVLLETSEFDRSFRLLLDDGGMLIFKMHGNRSNIVYCHDAEKTNRIFRNNLIEDRLLTWSSLQNELDLGLSKFVSVDGALNKFIPTLGPMPIAWAKQEGYELLDIREKFDFAISLLRSLVQPKYYIVRWQDKPHLSLLPIGEIVWEPKDAVEAAEAFTVAYGKYLYHEREQVDALVLVRKRIRQTEQYILKNEMQFNSLVSAIPNEEIGHLLMANLHNIKWGMKEVTLEDFYRDAPITIKLKSDLKPQDNAARYYRKAKNEQKEQQQLLDNITYREQQLREYKAAEKFITECTVVHELRKYIKTHVNLLKAPDAASLPYNEVVFEGYRVWIGRNAEANDQMLSKHAHKNDLWLHARNVAGSHVIIKFMAGSNFPSSVIRYAAGVAAWHSKAKTETLASVIYTPKKFVRKVKGAHAGAVMIDREEVIMVTPHPA
jgi:hypothetical protein